MSAKKMFDERVMVSMTKEMKKSLQKQADKLGIPLAELMRRKLAA
jgi:hypothetical protein